MNEPVTLDNIYQLFRVSQAECDRRLADKEAVLAERERREKEIMVLLPYRILGDFVES
ncbi:MAG: hypothetical protein ACRC6M_02215 [Microcystaceae cyanobacterium]